MGHIYVTKMSLKHSRRHSGKLIGIYFHPLTTKNEPPPYLTKFGWLYSYMKDESSVFGNRISTWEFTTQSSVLKQKRELPMLQAVAAEWSSGVLGQIAPQRNSKTEEKEKLESYQTATASTEITLNCLFSRAPIRLQNRAEKKNYSIYPQTLLVNSPLKKNCHVSKCKWSRNFSCYQGKWNLNSIGVKLIRIDLKWHR